MKETYSHTNSTLLQVKNLNISFGDRQVLKNFNLSIEKGKSYGLVGESGSGKSLSALSIMGLLPNTATITSGSILLHDRGALPLDLIQSSEEQQRNVRGGTISMIFQEPMTSLNPTMKCGKQVMEAVVLHIGERGKSAKERALSLLNEMMLPNPKRVFNSYPHQLSGGQKQRVMIAMALAGNPQLLIADEPTTALDVTVQKEVIELLKRIISQRNMSLLFISHDLDVVEEIAEQVIVLYNGEIVETGSANSILRTPNHPYTKGLIMCKPPLHYRPQKLYTLQDFLEQNEPTPNPNIETKGESIDLTSSVPLFEIKNLSVSYDTKKNFLGKPTAEVHAVNNLSLSLFPNETLGLVGESGCGKTTLSRAILALIANPKGDVFYKNKALHSMNRQELRQFRQEVQMVFQDPYASLNPKQTIAEILTEPIRYYGISTEKKESLNRVKQLLDMVALPLSSLYRYPHEFSGGQRQRIAIARALTVNPKVIICDEMVSALDVSVQAHILNLLNTLKRELSLTYLFISHDLAVVKYMSNRVVVMKDGIIAEIGSADEVYSNPQSTYTQRLIESIPGQNH